MRGFSRTKKLVAVYVLVLAAAAFMSVLEILGLLPLILLIAAAGGLLHLAYVALFAKLPDYLTELRNSNDRPRSPS